MNKLAPSCLALLLLSGCGEGARQDETPASAREIAADAAPSFDCASADGPVLAAICGSDDLSRLDTELQRLYALAESGTYATPERLEELTAMQRRWLERREACAKSEDVEACLFGRYAMRVHELRQGFADARSRDADGISHGPLALACDGADYGVSVTRFDDVPVAFVQWEGETRTLWQMVRGDPAYRSPAGERLVAVEFDVSGANAKFTPPGNAAMPCVVEVAD